MAQLRNPFRVERNGTVSVTMPEWLQDLLADLPQQLRELLDVDAPSTRRLFPVAYQLAGDEEREAEYRRLMREELVASRTAACEVVAATAHNTVISSDDLAMWVNVCNSVRLVLGTQLDVSEDDDSEPSDESERAAYEMYWLLGFLVECGVRTLADI
jgi:hypothetical protein